MLMAPLPPTPAATAGRMLQKYGIERALDAALDYRFNLYDYGTPGYRFWSTVVTLLLDYKKRHHGTSPKVPLTGI